MALTEKKRPSSDYQFQLKWKRMVILCANETDAFSVAKRLLRQSRKIVIEKYLRRRKLTA
jgi:hypothetical protein